MNETTTDTNQVTPDRENAPSPITLLALLFAVAFFFFPLPLVGSFFGIIALVRSRQTREPKVLPAAVVFLGLVSAGAYFHPGTHLLGEQIASVILPAPGSSTSYPALREVEFGAYYIPVPPQRLDTGGFSKPVSAAYINVRNLSSRPLRDLRARWTVRSSLTGRTTTGEFQVMKLGGRLGPHERRQFEFHLPYAPIHPDDEATIELIKAKFAP